MNRLSKLLKKKGKLNKKIEKLNRKIKQIDDEALSYKGKGGWGQDLFIQCLVENLHFEEVPETPGENSDLKCEGCGLGYKLVANKK